MGSLWARVDSPGPGLDPDTQRGRAALKARAPSFGMDLTFICWGTERLEETLRGNAAQRPQNDVKWKVLTRLDKIFLKNATKKSNFP